MTGLIDDMAGVRPPQPRATRERLAKAEARLSHHPHVGFTEKAALLRDADLLLDWDDLMTGDPTLPNCHAWQALGWDCP